jgi:acetyltransferase-like isoleucine patch superfamily enzyme
MVDRLLRRAALAHARLRHPGLIAASGASIDRSARLITTRPRGRITLGERSHLYPGVVLAAWTGSIELGPHVSLGPYTVVYGHGGVSIGAWTMLAPHCVVVSGTHVYEIPGPIRPQGETKRGVRIGSHVWVASHATITDGVTIGDDAIVAAGAVVRDDVPRGAIVGGVPARLLRYRPGYGPEAS